MRSVIDGGICRGDDDNDDDGDDAVTRRLKKMRRNNGGESWTVAEDALVKEMSERGCTNTEIARCLPGRTVNAVETRLVRLRDEGVLPRVFK